MSKKQKSSWSINWSLLLVVVILVSVITVGDFRIYPLVVNRAKNLVVNMVKNLVWDWTGFGESTTIEETRQKKDKTEILHLICN